MTSKVILVFFMGFLVACGTVGVSTSNIFHNTPSSDTLFMEGNGLVLGGSKFSNWPFPLPVCIQCTIESNRVMLPQGPERIVLATDYYHVLQVLWVDSKRPIKKYKDWVFKSIDDKSVQVCRAHDCVLVNQGAISYTESYAVALVFLKLETHKTGMGDSDSVQFQLVIQRI